MYVDTLELTLAHVDLGGLTEPIFVALCGDAHAHRITHGRDNSIDDIKDKSGRTLYPSHFATHLRVPASRLLDSFRLWDRISVGADVRAYAGMLLNATYVLGSEGEIADDPSSWDLDEFPSMKGGVVFVVAEGHVSNPEPSVPQSHLVAELPQLKAPPAFVDRFTQVQEQGMVDEQFVGALRATRPLSYEVMAERDVATGQALMFSSFSRLASMAERWLLAREIQPRCPVSLLDHFKVLERETYFLGNCYAGETVDIDVRASLSPCASDLHGSSSDWVSVGVLETSIEISNQRTNALLNVSNGKKLLLLPSSDESLLKDSERFLRWHAGKGGGAGC